MRERLQASPGPVALGQGVLLALLVASAAYTAPARAQSEGDAEAPKPAHLTLGAGAAYVPRYEGANESLTRGMPVLSYRSGRFFAGVLGGIGFNVSPYRTVEFGPVLSFRAGRAENNDQHLSGLGDIAAGADAGVFARWNLRPAYLHASFKQGVSGSMNGTQLRVGGGYAKALGAADRLVLDASVDWADSQVMQTYFGVSAEQSTASGLAAYDATSGLRRVSLSAIWTHTFTPQWFSSVSLSAYQLGDSAAHSPITQSRVARIASATIGYRFEIR